MAMASVTFTRTAVAAIVTFFFFFQVLIRSPAAGPFRAVVHHAENVIESESIIPVVSNNTKPSNVPIPIPTESQSPSRPISTAVKEKQQKVQKGPPAMGIVSMNYGENDLYNRAIDSHVRHAKRWGYPVYILRRDILEGVWSKLAYLLHVLVLEMEKDESRRTKWLMWFDADSVLINPALPLDIFLPPADFADVHFLATKDQNGFNAGMFMIRVHPKSIRIISKALAFPQFMPNVNLDYIEQTAIYHVLNETDFRNHVIYQPRIWYNTYEFHHAYEGIEGDILVHFPGLEDDRWNHMTKWLDIVEGAGQSRWEVPLSKTRYPNEIESFWATIRYGIQTLEAVRDRYKNFEDVPVKLKPMVKNLEAILWGETDQIPTMVDAISKIRNAMEDQQILDSKPAS